LPEPFGPINPMRSPSETVKEMFWKSGFAPKDFDISCALMIGGNGLVSPFVSGLRVSGNAPIPL
jgi:hypothetical protein